MPKQGSYKFPYDACFAGTRDQIESLYMWKQKVIEEIEYFRCGITKNNFVHTFSVKSEKHGQFAVDAIADLSDWLKEQGYKCTIIYESDHVELLVWKLKIGSLRFSF